MLPWTRIIFFITSVSGQKAVGISRDGVCSRAVNGCTGRGIGDRIIAARHVGKRPVDGEGGKRASGIARPRTANNSAVNSRSAIESGCVSGKQRQLTQIRRARASAWCRGRKIFRDGRARGLVVTSFSRERMNSRVSGFAVWRVAWLCVACWIVRRVTGSGVVGRVVSV
jgi:hypothetical protein